MASASLLRVGLVGAVVVAGSAVAVAVTSGGDSGSDRDAGSTQRSSEPLESLSGEAVPDATEIPEVLDFEAPLLDGGTLQGAQYRDTGVALWFWAPW